MSRRLTLVTDPPAGDGSDEDFLTWVSRPREPVAPPERAARTPDGALFIMGSGGAVFIMPDNQRDP